MTCPHCKRRHSEGLADDKACLADRLQAADNMLRDIHEIVDHLSCAHGFQSCIVCEVKAVLAGRGLPPIRYGMHAASCPFRTGGKCDCEAVPLDPSLCPSVMGHDRNNETVICDQPMPCPIHPKKEKRP